VSDDKWRTRPISDLYTALYDGPHATPKPSDDGPVFLGIKNIREDGLLDFSEIRHIAEEDFPRWIRRVEPRPGDIVFTYEATLNRYAIIPDGFRGCLGRRLALIRPDPKKVDARFLFYYFFGTAWRNTVAQKTIFGSTVDRIPLLEFPNFQVCVPRLAVQRKIAAILSAYDDLIENNRRRIEILEEMARRIYREWFVEFRFPGHEKVRFVDSALGKIPEGWKVKKLGEAMSLEYGKSLRSTDRTHGEFPVYGSSGLVGWHNAALVPGPGIIVGRKGNVGSVHWSDLPFFPIDTVYYVVTDVPLRYVWFNLQTQNFINNDAAVPGLSRNQAYSLPFVRPTDPTLAQFDALVAPFFANIRNLSLRNDNLQETRDLLLPRLISGELDVSELPIDTGADDADGR